MKKKNGKPTQHMPQSHRGSTLASKAPTTTSPRPVLLARTGPPTSASVEPSSPRGPPAPARVSRRNQQRTDALSVHAPGPSRAPRRPFSRSHRPRGTSQPSVVRRTCSSTSDELRSLLAWWSFLFSPRSLVLFFSLATPVHSPLLPHSPSLSLSLFHGVLRRGGGGGDVDGCILARQVLIYFLRC